MARALNTTNIYGDFRTDFLPHPVSTDLAKLNNEDAVIRSIKNICLTAPYERFWNPRFGAGLSKYLFEPISYITEDLIKNAIISAIANYEPRALTYEVYVSAQPDQNAYNATIVFTVINNPSAVSFSFLLNRIR
jgi:phage baseplate assembly protein W